MHLQSPESEWVEPLSEREIEVLKLIANGLTNPIIAAKLFLPLKTVKFTPAISKVINGELVAHRWAVAVARGRALGVLSPN